MTATVSAPEAVSGVQSLWRRQIHHYPENRTRVWYLAIVVAATIVLYYELYIGGAVSPSIIAGDHMTFPFYVYLTVAGNAVGAFGSLAAGLGDRWGRANMVAYGLVITGLLVLIGIPNISGKWAFAILYAIVGMVEGVILVATPALVRDYSPQLGRASAMGFWTLGPVIGSLVVAVVSSNTVNHLHAWQDQFLICGVVGVVVGVVALFGLKELSPQLRDQLMVSHRDRALVEARARGLDIEDSLRRPWAQMLKLDVIGSAFAIAVFLLIYYTAVGFFTVFFTTLHGFSLSKANSIGDWFWGFDAGALIIVGIISDRLRVRKPFMVIGAIGAIVMTIIFLNLGAGTSYSTFALVISINAVFLAIAYAPWMASFTETVEARNPALVATGLAVWGWIIRAVIAISVAIMPLVITSMTPLVTYGTQAQTIQAQYPQQVQTLGVIDAKTAATLHTGKSGTTAYNTAVGVAVKEISGAFKISSGDAVNRLLAASKVPAADQTFLAEHGQDVLNASNAAPNQWKTWWWVCVGGEVLFLPFILLMTGRWSPRKAREDADAHQLAVERELSALDQA